MTPDIPRRSMLDLALAVALFGIVTTLAWIQSDALPGFADGHVIRNEGGTLNCTIGWLCDRWFEADFGRLIGSETYRDDYGHFRNNVHPLYSLIVFPMRWAVQLATGASDWATIRLLHAGIAGVLAVLLYALARQRSGSRSLALLATALGCSSSAFLFWAPVPESFALGAISIGLVLLAYPAAWTARVLPWIGLNIVALSITVTNISVSALGSFFRLGALRASLALVVAFVVTFAASVAQERIFPASTFFLVKVQREARYVDPTLNGPRDLRINYAMRAVGMLSDPFIMAGITELPTATHRPHIEVLKPNYLQPTSILAQRPPLPVLVGLACWWALLALGLWHAAGSWRGKDARATDTVVVAALFLAGQFTLHLVYGEMIFTYSLHAIPAVVVLLASLQRTGFARLAMVLMAMALPISLWWNWTMYPKAAAALHG
jgi:hypothetical protein